MTRFKEDTVKPKPTETAPAGLLELARTEVVRLNDAERDLSRLYQSKALELSAARAKRGDDVLAAHDPASAAREASRQVAVMVEELAALGDAAAAARRQRMSAIPRVFAVEADELDRQSAQRKVDAAANKAAADEKRRELEAIAGCGYVSADELAYARRGQLGGGGGSLSVMTVQIPIFKQLQLEAEELSRRAVQVRLQEPHKAGSVEAETFGQLVDVVFADAMRVGPSVDQISGWYEQAVEKVRRRRQQLELDDVPINVVHLQWVRGQIDVAASFVSSSTQSTPGVQTIDTDADFAAAAATETQPQAPKPHPPKNVIYGGSATGKQEVDLDDEYARAAATEQR